MEMHPEKKCESMMSEPYMNTEQLAYFKNKLLLQKMELEAKMALQREKYKTMKDTLPDILDKSNFLMEMDREIRNQERYSQLIRQVNRALEKIDDGSFGYCESTGTRIGLKRLEAIPFAALSIAAMERHI